MGDPRVVRRGYCNIGDSRDPQNIHYYQCGEGPALLLLHPSPAAASTFLPLLPLLGEHVTAIAIDTPGYGWSDPLPLPANDLQPYVGALERFRVAMGLDDIAIYGSATGSQIATEYAKAHTQHCKAVILDNVADFPEDVYRATIDGYFPDLSIDVSGSHLTRTWGMALDLMRFFPWQSHAAMARLPARPLDPSIVQQVLLQFLQAGAGYDMAYRVAFVNERADRLLPLTAPTVIIRSSGSLVKAYADRFDQYDWPNNFRMQHCGPSPQERQQAVVQAVAGSTADQAPARAVVPDSSYGRRVVALASGNISLIRTAGTGTPSLVLHPVGGSSAAAMRDIGSLDKAGPVIAPDLPGHGASDGPPADVQDFLELCVSWLEALLDALSVQQVNIVAIREAAPVAMRLADSARVTEVALLDPVAEIVPIPNQPRLDGSHLATLWHHYRNCQLYFDPQDWHADSALEGTPNLDPADITQQVLDRLLCDRVYASAVSASNAFATAKAIAKSRIPVRIVRTRDLTDGDRSRRSLSDVATTDEVKRLSHFFSSGGD